MPVNPVSIQNPYGLPPLNSGEDDPIARLQREYAEEEADPNLQMVRSIAKQAQQPGQDQGALSRALAAAAVAVPMSEWKPPAESLPISRREHMRTILASRERQLRALEAYASDPSNPATQESVEEIRQKIEAEAQNALKNSTLPSPVAMYETLVEDEQPEVFRAKHREMLLTIPGMKEEWASAVTFDPETNEPVYPKWMEGPLEAAMSRAMGVEEPDTAKVDAARKAAFTFEDKRLKGLEPQADQYENQTDFEADHKAWENKVRQNFVRNNPQAAQYLPTFAEEQGFGPPLPEDAHLGAWREAELPEDAHLGTWREAQIPEGGSLAVMPKSGSNELEIQGLRNRLAMNGMESTVAQSPDELRTMVESGDVQPGMVVIISDERGTFGARMEPDGSFKIVSRFDSRQ